MNVLKKLFKINNHNKRKKTFYSRETNYQKFAEEKEL